MSSPHRPRNWGWGIRVSGHTALFDACVLYPAPLRDLLIELSAGGMFRARWTRQIHDEWIENLLRSRPDLGREQLERTRDLMNAAVPDCLVDRYEDLISAVELPDRDDRHVLAAAIKGSCDAIVTFNLRDFPAEALNRYHLEALHPDDFILRLSGLDQAGVLTAAKTCRQRLRNPARRAAEYLNALRFQSLPKTVSELAKYESII
jgi:predicted nucleic acid-binding protein